MQINSNIFFLLLFVSISINAQKTEAQLVFKDGTKLKGLGRLTKEGVIKFRKNIKEERQTYTFNEVDTLLVSSKFGGYDFYVEVKVKNQYPKKILRIAFMGDRLVCYEDYAMTYRAIGSANSSMGGFYTVANSFLRKVGEKEAIQLVNYNVLFPKSFRKSASSYFKDCPDLAEKILAREFKQEDLKEVVQYYNYQCK